MLTVVDGDSHGQRTYWGFGAAAKACCQEIYFHCGTATALIPFPVTVTGPPWDIETAFAKRHVVHPRFRGSSSIKQVLPALVPEMTYEGLAIGEGSAASRAYTSLTQGKLALVDAQRTRNELLQYCGQDTLAMVKLLQVLKRLQA